MNTEVTNRLINKVIRLSKINRYKSLRIFRNLHKIFVYNILLLLNKTMMITTSTFWGGKMQIILPERVSFSIWRNTYFDENVTIFLLKYLKKNETFIDIGAHFGFYSLLGSYLVGANGRIISFEPTPNTFKQLKINCIKFAHFKNIDIYNKAVYLDDKVIELQDFGIVNSAFNTIKEVRISEKINSNFIKVSAVSLDRFIEENYPQLQISMIKIDAESAELEILKGAKKIINTYNPKIILEVGDIIDKEKYHSKNLVEFMLGLGYKAYGFIDGIIVEHKKLEVYNYDNIIFMKN